MVSQPKQEIEATDIKTKKAPYHARRVPPEVQRPETEEKKEHKKLKKYQGLREELENTYIYLYIIFFLSQPGTRGQ